MVNKRPRGYQIYPITWNAQFSHKKLQTLRNSVLISMKNFVLLQQMNWKDSQNDEVHFEQLFCCHILYLSIFCLPFTGHVSFHAWREINPFYYKSLSLSGCFCFNVAKFTALGRTLIWSGKVDFHIWKIPISFAKDNWWTKNSFQLFSTGSIHTFIVFQNWNDYN